MLTLLALTLAVQAPSARPAPTPSASPSTPGRCPGEAGYAIPSSAVVRVRLDVAGGGAPRA